MAQSNLKIWALGIESLQKTYLFFLWFDCFGCWECFEAASASLDRSTFKGLAQAIAAFLAAAFELFCEAS